jgi:hypothetical protein
LIEARPTVDLGFTAPRPLYSVLGSERGWLLPPLENALSRYLRERELPLAKTQSRETAQALRRA